jgi:hypothetical protein
MELMGGLCPVDMGEVRNNMYQQFEVLILKANSHHGRSGQPLATARPSLVLLTTIYSHEPQIMPLLSFLLGKNQDVNSPFLQGQFLIKQMVHHFRTLHYFVIFYPFGTLSPHIHYVSQCGKPNSKPSPIPP